MLNSLAEKINIRLMKEADLEVAEQLLVAGYGGSTGRIPELKRLLKIQPDGWIFACQNDQPVGLGGSVIYDHFAYIGMMVVLPQMQRHGIGRKIFESILARINEYKCDLALLDATESGAALYQHYGFKPVDQACQYVNLQPSVISHPCPAIDLVSSRDLKELAEFDAPLFGSNRLRVFQAYWDDFKERFLFKHNSKGEISGYLLALPSRIGPWAALTPEDAGELMEAAFVFHFDNEVSVIAPAANPNAERIFTEAGFQFSRALPHMANKAVNIARRRDLIYGQTSFAIG